MAENNNKVSNASILQVLGDRSIVMVGLMGAGKTSIGRLLAKRLDLPFVDADVEIERAAGKTITEIFADHGEEEFRRGEKRVIARILEKGPQVMATGGGAFMDEDIRKNIERLGLSIWLSASLNLLYERVKRRTNRPLLKQGDMKETLRELIDARYPVYAKADIEIVSEATPVRNTVNGLIEKLEVWAMQTEAKK